MVHKEVYQVTILGGAFEVLGGTLEVLFLEEKQLVIRFVIHLSAPLFLGLAGDFSTFPSCFLELPFCLVLVEGCAFSFASLLLALMGELATSAKSLWD